MYKNLISGSRTDFVTAFVGNKLANDKDLQLLAANKHIASIDLSECRRITDQGFHQLDLGSLESLDIQECRELSIKTVVRSLHQKCPKLKSLALGNSRGRNRLEDDSLKLIANELPGLQEIHLRGCELVAKPGYDALQQFNELQVLKLEYCRHFTDQCLESLARTSLKHDRLRSLLITNTREFTGRGLEHLNVSSLTELDLSFCWGLVDDALRPLQNATRLRTLRLEYSCADITDVGLAHLMNLGSSLTSFGFGGQDSASITDDFLSQLSSWTTLESLEIYGCPRITDNGMRTLLERLKMLQHLKIYSCPLLTGDFITPSMKTTMRSIEIRRCSLLKCGVIQSLSTMQRLKHLSIHGCPNITIERIKSIQPQLLEEFSQRLISVDLDTDLSDDTLVARDSEDEYI